MADREGLELTLLGIDVEQKRLEAKLDALARRRAIIQSQLGHEPEPVRSDLSPGPVTLARPSSLLPPTLPVSSLPTPQRTLDDEQRQRLSNAAKERWVKRRERMAERALAQQQAQQQK